jgi:poly(A) polymerase Pap1
MLRDWPAVTEISAVESAFVPVMKTVISGVEVDLLFARVNLAEAGDKLDIEKDEILRGVDDASQRSLNGQSGTEAQTRSSFSRSQSYRYDPKPGARCRDLPDCFTRYPIVG